MDAIDLTPFTQTHLRMGRDWSDVSGSLMQLGAAYFIFSWSDVAYVMELKYGIRLMSPAECQSQLFCLFSAQGVSNSQRRAGNPAATAPPLSG
ncbi:hypothetical protein, unlikely [Trypanosoma brucei brucei TREU927]|uniref:Uncharacterized protein n=1 Tax=Trypanosoma brucei brucei (strain 927/4 GUTat10.1) TaxID=185431 RepID=Q38CR5_TRYB2|nr:hypothetical protein, unlikely [Trypanosoma brucei brucei TREU927]EAN77405.1 hypothetical protein, unlikely [Trypanosoma brucei brucei TREU927]